MTVVNSSSLQALATFSERLKVPYSTVRVSGRVASISANAILVSGLSHSVNLGDFVSIDGKDRLVYGQVTQINGETIGVQTLGSQSEIGLDCKVTPAGMLKVFPDATWLGRIVNALGLPVDGGSLPIRGGKAINLESEAPKAMQRDVVRNKAPTGVKAIDVFTPLCFGQRIGVFAGSGVGKSTLLAMLAKSPGFDCVVVGLIGERGREVREFVEQVLGSSREKAVIIVATADEPPLMRKLASNLATSLAEFFRDLGNNVLLIMDSVTRFAHACREIALSAGEPPVARGFPPSVFSTLPNLLERAGPGIYSNGSITGIYAVLVDGDDHNDPIADSIRGTLDGHIVLDRQIASGGRYPAIDLLGSISRLAQKAWTLEEAKIVSGFRKLISKYEESRDLRALGGYARGLDPELDHAMSVVPKLYAALEQSIRDEPCFDAIPLIMKAIRASGQ
jgi:flagellum-specific ATP synthase